MNKLILIIAVALMFSCNNDTKKSNAEMTTKTAVAAAKKEMADSKIGRKNFAVVWEWATKDVNLVNDNAPKIAMELTTLWKKEIVENAYYNSSAKVDKLDNFPNISFFIKAQSKSEAELIINKLTVVQKGIATYKLFPVGTKWLDRKHAKINKKGLTSSYVAVWETTSKDKSAIRNQSKAQSDAIVSLWKDGVIENVYFDIAGTQKSNNETDFVFFVNANSEKDAKIICNKLPFVVNGLATYKLLPVGIFWMGEYKG